MVKTTNTQVSKKAELPTFVVMVGRRLPDVVPRPGRLPTCTGLGWLRRLLSRRRLVDKPHDLPDDRLDPV
jgi:hypothetical protein